MQKPDPIAISDYSHRSTPTVLFSFNFHTNRLFDPYKSSRFGSSYQLDGIRSLHITSFRAAVVINERPLRIPQETNESSGTFEDEATARNGNQRKSSQLPSQSINSELAERPSNSLSSSVDRLLRTLQGTLGDKATERTGS